MNEIGVVGLATTKKPFTLTEIKNNTFVILYGDKLMGNCSGFGADSLATLIDLLNKAFQLGFHDCGNELMPKMMGTVSKDVITKIKDLITELKELNECSPLTPYRNCKVQEFCDCEHYSCHPTDRRRIIEELSKLTGN